MAELNDWSVTAANNNSAPPNGWPENTMQYSEVNDTAREGMAVVKRYFADMNGSLTTTGAADAYLVTLNAGYAAYFAGMTFTVKISADNTGASTINVNSLGVKSIVNPDGGALNAGQLKNGGVYRLAYDGTNFQIVGGGAYGALAQQDTINNDDWSGTDLAVVNGGTGASDATTARSNLGLGSIATVNSPVPIANGGTASATAADARTALGLAIGTNVQAWDTNLDQIAALAVTDSNFIVGNGSAWVAESGATARTSLGLGTIATQNAASVAITGGSITGITDLAVADGGTGSSTASGARTALGLAIGTNVQAWDTNLDQIAALAVTDGNIIVGNGSAWVAESGATARTSLGLGTASSVQFSELLLTAINIGSTDTTVTRAAAGQIAVEDKAAFMHNASTGTYASAQVFFSTSAPTTEGNNGDIYFEYTA